MLAFAAYLRRLHPWLAETKPAAVALAISAAAVAVALSIRCEPAFRYCGALLSAAGIVTVVYDISSKRRAAGRPSALARLKSWWGRRPRWQQSVNANIFGNAAAVSGAFANAHALIGPTPGPSTDQRVAALERAFNDLSERVARSETEADEALRDVRQRISDEAAAREQQDRANRELINEGLAGGLDWAAVGVVWLALGLVLSTIATDVGACDAQRRFYTIDPHEHHAGLVRIPSVLP